MLVGPFEMQPADAVHVDVGERRFEPRKPRQRAHADAAAARLVARKRGAIDEQRRKPGGRERPRRDGAGRPGAGDDDVSV